MSDPKEDSASDAAAVDARPRRRAIIVWVFRWIAVGGLVAIVGLAAWTAHDVLQMRTQLQDARSAVGAAQAAAQRGDRDAVDRSLRTATESAARAADSAHDGLLDEVAAVPWLGEPIESGRQIADVVRDVARDALPPAATAAGTLTRRPLLASGAVDLQSIVDARQPLTTAQTAIEAAAERVRRIDVHTWLPAVNSAGRDLAAEIGRLQSTVRASRIATDLVPDMLGANGRRTYLIALQNNAEARGTGGLVGGFIMLTADRGRIIADQVVKDLALPPGRSIDLGPQYEALYGAGDPTQIWQNSNLSPHFPYAAQIWRSLARQLTGVTADVVVGVDPVGISKLMAVTGPVTLPDGGTADTDNIVELTESSAYARFDGDRSDRKTYLADIAEATIDRITTGRFDTTALAKAFADAIGDGRIAAWSQRPSEQARIAATALGHDVPYSPAPYAAVVINNSYASKLDYYLTRDIRYRYGTCSDGRQRVRVVVTLSNNVPMQRFSPEVLGTFLPVADRLPLRSNRVTVSLYASWGSHLTGLTVDGTPTGVGSGSELGHPVSYAVVTLPPATPVTVEFDLSEPVSSVAPTLPVQPMTNPARVFRSGTQCTP
ncbi:DUF4012 domain-containing protein [Williamsia sp. MIQD14]|uniref:DUF4012 domain-containing protein n=1 Tax=Williamsia sp. MIQD14 TaxID=3425703 RepID=UPI003DA1A608